MLIMLGFKLCSSFKSVSLRVFYLIFLKQNTRYLLRGRVQLVYYLKNDVAAVHPDLFRVPGPGHHSYWLLL